MKTTIAVRLGTILLGAGALLAGCVTDTTSDVVQSATNTVTGVLSSTSPDSDRSAFVSDRFKAIRAEAAKGQGENVDALAAMLGESDREEFARWMQTNYKPLFTDLKTPEELLARIKNLRSSNG
jgi:hypothetical protein